LNRVGITTSFWGLIRLESHNNTKITTSRPNNSYCIDYNHPGGGRLVLGKFIKYVTDQNRFVVRMGVVVLITRIFWAFG